MRKQIGIGTAAVLSFSIVMAAASADEEKLPIDKLPAAVLKAVKNKFPKANIEEAVKEVESGTTTYEVRLEQGDRSIDVSLNADGEILEIEKEVAVEDLPKGVKKKLAAKFPGAKIARAEEITKGEGPVRYEVAIMSEVVLTAKGKIIDQDDEEEDDDDKPAARAKKREKDKDEDDDDHDDDDKKRKVKKIEKD